MENSTQTVQVNPTEKPKFNTHKVFAAIGIILTVVILIIAALWYFVGDTFNTDDENNTVKVSTSSAKPSTNSATKSATISAE